MVERELTEARLGEEEEEDQVLGDMMDFLVHGDEGCRRRDG
jgi:hypothetical protein